MSALFGVGGGEVSLGTAFGDGGNPERRFCQYGRQSEKVNGTGAPDVFLLGGGLDVVFGRDGLEVFRFQTTAIGPAATNATTLKDFSRAGGEVIDLSAVDAIGGTFADDAFSFIGAAPFSGAAGQLRWEDDGAVRMIQGTVNADAMAGFTMYVKTAGQIGGDWFVV